MPKQKLDTKISTEGEIVLVSDYLPNMVWERIFLLDQGFLLGENILYQENQSAIKIKKNGRISSGKNTKHMSNIYFWIKERVKTKGITIEHCHCHAFKIFADFFTNPLKRTIV